MERPDDLLTIKAFSEASGRSQQAIYKQISTRLATYVHEKDGQKYIERCALNEVFKIESIQPIQPVESGKTFNVEQRLNATMQTTIDFLQEQIRVKDQQLETKDKQLAAQAEQLNQLTAALEHTTASLQASQALHAGTMQRLNAAEPEESSAGDEKAERELVQREKRRWQWPWKR